jgi:peptidoglycan/LPS O-acetylase OafA/YrhL
MIGVVTLCEAPMAVADIPSAIQNPEMHKVRDYPFFDWLRFILASIVVLSHSHFTLLPFLNGSLAVKVFFALSGWLIGGILLNTQKSELPRFFFNRATRIWIPYAVAILMIYGLAAVKEGVDFFWFKYLLLDVTFTHQLYTFFPAALFEMPMDGSGNQFWSIAVEEQFYLFAPVMMLFVPKGRTLWFWLPFAALTTALDVNAASVSLGVCAAIVERDYRISENSLVRIICCGVILATAILMSIMRSEYVIGPIFAVAVIVAAAMTGKRSSVGFIAGGVSYPLYLNAWIGGFIVNFFQKRWIPLDHTTNIIITYIMAVLVALPLYWMIDRQVQIRRNSWYSATLGRRLGVTAYCLVAIGVIAGGLVHIYGPHAVVPAGYVGQH